MRCSGSTSIASWRSTSMTSWSTPGMRLTIISMLRRSTKSFGKTYLKLEKCEFHRPSIPRICHQCSRSADGPGEVRNWPIPSTIKDLQRFIKFANFYRSFISNFSKIASLLTSQASVLGSSSHNHLPMAEGSIHHHTYAHPPWHRAFDCGWMRIINIYHCDTLLDCTQSIMYIVCF